MYFTYMCEKLVKLKKKKKKVLDITEYTVKFQYNDVKLCTNAKETTWFVSQARLFFPPRREYFIRELTCTNY